MKLYNHPHIFRSGCLALFLALAACAPFALAQSRPSYDTLIQQGKAELQSGNNDQALATGEQAIKLDPNRWEAYALAGGALMNLKHYARAATNFNEAAKRAPQAKQSALLNLRRQALLDAAGVTQPSATTPATTSQAPPASAPVTQAEIVLWEAIKNSTNVSDFQAYLTQYPNGAFVVLARSRLRQLREQAKLHGSDLVGTIWAGPMAIHDPGQGVTVVAFTGPTEFRWESGCDGACIGDAVTMPFDAFIQKDFPDAPIAYGTWSQDNAQINLTSRPGKTDTCKRARFFFTGIRGSDSMKGSWRTRGYCFSYYNTAYEDGDWQFFPVVRDNGGAGGPAKVAPAPAGPRGRAVREQEAVKATAERGRDNLLAATSWTDPNTGLTWAVWWLDWPENFSEAHEYCNNLRLAGHSDWRLPAAPEFLEMYQDSGGDPRRELLRPFYVWTTTAGRKVGEHIEINDGKPKSQSDLKEEEGSGAALCVRNPGVRLIGKLRPRRADGQLHRASLSGRRHNFVVTSVAYSPDGHMLASCSYGRKTIELWDLSGQTK